MDWEKAEKKPDFEFPENLKGSSWILMQKKTHLFGQFKLWVKVYAVIVFTESGPGQQKKWVKVDPRRGWWEYENEDIFGFEELDHLLPFYHKNKTI